MQTELLQQKDFYSNETFMGVKIFKFREQKSMDIL